MRTVKVHFDGKTLVLDEPVSLPQNQQFVAHLEESRAPKPQRRKRVPHLFRDPVTGGLDAASLKHDQYLYKGNL